MKLYQIIIVLLSIFHIVSSGSINLTPDDEANYGAYFQDKTNILTVDPDEFKYSKKPEASALKTASNDNYLDPSFKAVLQDISDNSHFLSTDSKDESKYLNANQNYQKSLDETVDHEMNEISRESREEGFRVKNQEMSDIYASEMPIKTNNNFLKPRFLQKSSSETENPPDIYDPTELGIN